MNTEENSSTSFSPLAGPVLVGALAAVFMALRFSEFPVGAGMDDAYYIEMARSVAEGRGPVIHLGGAGPGWRPDIFPLGFPLLLSPLALLAPSSLAVFKLVPMLALLSLVPLCLRLTRGVGPWARLGLTALVCLNPWAVAFATRVFSDLPFTAVSLAAVLLFLDEDGEGPPSRWKFVALIAMTGLGIMVRSIGLALLLAMAVSWLSRGRWRSALALCGGVAAVLLPHALAGGGTGGGLVTGAYLDQVFSGGGTAGSPTAAMAANLVGYLKELPVVLLPVFGTPLEMLADRAGLGSLYGPLQLLTGIVLACGIMWGLLAAEEKRRPMTRFLAIYLVVYGAVLLKFSGYPSGVQSRLLLPVLPFLFLGLGELWAGPARFRNRSPLWPAVAILLAMALIHNAYRVVRPLTGAADSAFIDPAPGSVWIRDNTDPADVVMTRWPLRQHIHFLRPVVGFGTVGPDELERRIERFGVDHVFLGPGEYGGASTALLDLLEEDPRRFQPVHREDGTRVVIFSIRKDP